MVEIQARRGKGYAGGFSARFVAGRKLTAERGKADAYGYPATADVSLVLQARLGRAQSRTWNFNAISDIELIAKRGMAKTYGCRAEGIFATHSQHLKATRGLAQADGFPARHVLNILENIEWNDDVFLLIVDHQQTAQFYRGVVRDIEEDDRFVSVQSVMGAGLLSERVIEEDYEQQDIGQTVEDIILDYCRPLTAENVDTETGIEAPINAEGEKPIRILENLRRRYNIFYFVDSAWDVHFYMQNDIEEGPYTIRLGEEE